MAMKKKMAAAAGAMALTLAVGGTVLAAPGLPGLPGGAGGGKAKAGADGANGANGNQSGGNGGSSGQTGQGGKGAPGGAGARGGDTIIRGGQGAANNIKRRAFHAHQHGRAADPRPTNGFDF